jgi:hypothetical protein
MASSLVPEHSYPVFAATEMKTNVVRVLEKPAVSEPRAATGARRSDDNEGRTALRLAIEAMPVMNGFWRPDAHLHS